MSLPYYRFFPGDYDRDTRHLSMMQHGAYRLLIDAYMAHGPLPNDLQRLYRLCSAFSVEERAAIEYVLTEFFKLNETHWYQSRCEREIEWQKTRSDAAVEANRVRWQSKWMSKWTPNQNQNQNQNHISELDKDLDKVLKPLARSDVPSSSPTVIEIPLNDGTHFQVTEDHVKDLDALYPGVDPLVTLKQIKGWSISNPTRRKTKRGMLRHIHSWFSKEQNHA